MGGLRHATAVLAASVVATFMLLAATPAHAGFDLGLAATDNYGILYEGNGGNTLSFNNSTEVGNIGTGNTGKFQGNGPGTITGNIDFSAANTGQFSNSGLTINGSVNYSVSNVTTALNTVNTLSHDLGLEAGTSTTISSGGSINASSGTLDAGGNRVFTVTSINFPNGTFTINGTGSDFVVLNIAGSVGSNGLNGSVVLAGGITADQVLFNFTPDTSVLTTYNNDYTNLSGGPTMTISNNGVATAGVFLDPTGPFQVNHSGPITGRVIGGDTHNSSFVSGGNLITPTNEVTVIPEPATLLLVGTVFAGLGAWGRKRLFGKTAV